MSVEIMTPKEKLLKGLALLEVDKNPLRQTAKMNIEELDFPNSKTEYWKYTRVGKIIRSSFGIQKLHLLENIAPYLIKDLAADVVVIENGFLNQNISCLSDWKAFVKPIESFEKEQIHYKEDLFKTEKEIFNSINSAYFTGGVCINIPKNKKIDTPLIILNIITQSQIISLPKIIVNAQQGSDATIIEKNIIETVQDGFLNASLQVVVEPNARLNYFIKQKVENQNYIIYNQSIHQYKDSFFNINTASIKGTIVRNNLNIYTKEPGTETHLNGVFVASKQNHIDNHTIVDHLAPNCNSNEHYKGVMAKNGVGVFNGKVMVRPGAQKINAFQQNNNVLLSDDAQVYSKPELEIYADDVKCSHGSTTGQLNEEALFYLRTRGIGIKKAKALLLHAFVYEAIENINVASYREELLNDLTAFIDHA